MKRSARSLVSRAAGSRPTPRSTVLLSSSSILPQSASPQIPGSGISSTRSLFGFSRSSTPKKNGQTIAKPPPAPPLFGPDDLFHPLESSPVPSLRSKSNLIKSLAPCPVCLSHAQTARSAVSASSAASSSPPTPTSVIPPIKKVSHSCPSCGFPSHCSAEHYEEGKAEHAEYCGRLREVNEDEHDLRSGRVVGEFEMPGPQDYESTISLSSWDTLFYTRNHTSIDTDRSRRHVSKLLTYPITIGGVLSNIGPFAGGKGRGDGGRLTKEGKRSLAALYTSLHPPIGATPSPQTRNAKLPIRIFILGARAESSLPPHIYEQLCCLFPFTQFRIFFVGPQAALPLARMKGRAEPKLSTKVAGEAGKVEGSEGKRSEVELTDAPDGKGKIYSPGTPTQNSETEGKGHLDTANYGVPSYTITVSPTLTLTTLQTPYETVHEQFGPFDPYTDVFFSFCPGFGFPSSTVPGTLQAETEWSESLKKVLETKCAVFVTGFSPRDVERDFKSLDKVEGVRGEYDVLLEPGENPFSSLKWEAGDFDPRVLVRVNWGVWGFRGKRYEVKAAEAEESS